MPGRVEPWNKKKVICAIILIIKYEHVITGCKKPTIFVSFCDVIFYVNM